MPEYEVYGPFELDQTAKGFVDSSREAKRVFWELVEATEEGLAGSRGCYIFCTGRGNKIRPWYVGKTNNRGGFSQEVFQPHKLNMYHRALEPYDSKPNPSLVFVPRLTRSGRFAKNIPPNELDWLEKMMIGAALRRNIDLTNMKDTKLLRKLQVPGFLGKLGAGVGNATSIKALRKCLL